MNYLASVLPKTFFHSGFLLVPIANVFCDCVELLFIWGVIRKRGIEGGGRAWLHTQHLSRPPHHQPAYPPTQYQPNLKFFLEFRKLPRERAHTCQNFSPNPLDSRPPTWKDLSDTLYERVHHAYLLVIPTFSSHTSSLSCLSWGEIMIYKSIIKLLPPHSSLLSDNLTIFQKAVRLSLRSQSHTNTWIICIVGFTQRCILPNCPKQCKIETLSGRNRYLKSQNSRI